MGKKFYMQCLKTFFFMSAFIPLTVLSQPGAGDYRSNISGDWNAISTWEKFNGIVWMSAVTPPSSGDGVITISHVVTVNSAISADQVIVNGRLDVNSTLTIDDGTGTDLDVNGTLDLSGILNGNGTVNVGGMMNWTANFISVNLTIELGGDLVVSSSNNKTLIGGRTLLNVGTINWTGGNIHFNGGTLTNAHIIIASSNNSFVHISNTNLFNNTNAGVISKSGGGTTSFGIPVTNAGTVNINSGTVVFGSSTTNTGTVNGASGTSIQNSSNFTNSMNLNMTQAIFTNTGVFTNNGDVTLTEATLTNIGAFTNNGDMIMTSDVSITTITNNAGATFTNNGFMDMSSDSTLTVINSGTFTNDVNMEMSSPSLTVNNIDGGTFTNNGDIDFGSAASITTISNSGGSTVIQNSDMTFTGTATLTNVGNWYLNTTQFLTSGITLNNYGNLSGSGTLVVFGSMTWLQGIISFNLTISPGATLTVSGNGSKKLYSGMTLLNQGTMNWPSGNIYFNSATLTNENIITASNILDNGFIHEANSNIFNNTNTGIFTKTTGTGTTSFGFNIMVTNAGIINVNSGRVLFSGATTHTGTINVATGATLHNTGVPFTDNGTINIPSATFNNSDGGVFTQNNLISFTNGVIIDNSSIWNMNVDQSLGSGITFNHSGYLRGTGSIIVNGLMNWTNNEVSINLTIASGATLTVSKPQTCICNKKINNGKTVLNQGTMNWSGGNIYFNSGTLINENIFTASNDYAFIHEANANLFNNTATGVFTKSAGSGTTSFGIVVTNAGIININSGTVLFGGATTHTGTISTISGTTIQNINNFNDNGTINIASATFTNSDGGTFIQNNLISFTGTVIINNSSVWNVEVAQTLGATNTLNHSGYLRGTGSVVVNGLMNWTNNEVAVNITIESGATLTVSSGSNKLLNSNKMLLNRGTMNWTGGNIEFNGGTIRNENILMASSNNTFGHISHTNLFANTVTGVFTKSTASGTTGFGIPVTNAGIIKGIGSIHFSAMLLNNGTIAPGLSPGIFTVNGTEPFSSNSILSIEIQDGSGTGTGHDQLQRAGNLTLAGTLNVTEAGTVPVGSYTIISLTSGTISGNFSTTNLPIGYTMAVNPVSVVLTKTALATFYQDADIDTYGNPAVSTQAPSAPPGYVSNNTDCNDAASAVHPGATEVCNGIDDDCDGLIDEGVQLIFYQDTDSDGYGNISATIQACTAPSGYVNNNTDCNDANAGVHPGATEVCNGIDDDCDGLIDEGVQLIFYQDADSDGYGNISVTIQACTAPSGYVNNNTDCNDANAGVHPGATEVCNGIDDDCDGLIDEGVQLIFYQDADSDGYGNIFVTIQACTAPSGYLNNNMDCDDTNASIHPGATELCNGIDDDCDGIIDEGCPTGVTISIADITVLESAGPALVPVTLSAPSTLTITVKYKTMNGTAHQRRDYTSTSGILTFLPGQTSKNISIPVVADTITEGNENFFVHLSKPVNAVISDGNATITITESAPREGVKSNPVTEVQNPKETKPVIPNPQRKQELLRFLNLPPGSFDIVLMDVNGRVILNLRKYQNNRSMERLVPGIYFYQVLFKNQKDELIKETGKLFITD